MDAAKRCAYAALAVLVQLYNAWKHTRHIADEMISFLFPGRRRIPSPSSVGGGGSHGSAPKDPSILGVVLTEQLWSAEDGRALETLLSW
jgi:hypothetical protein